MATKKQEKTSKLEKTLETIQQIDKLFLTLNHDDQGLTLLLLLKARGTYVDDDLTRDLVA